MADKSVAHINFNFNKDRFISDLRKEWSINPSVDPIELAESMIRRRFERYCSIGEPTNEYGILNATEINE